LSSKDEKNFKVQSVEFPSFDEEEQALEIIAAARQKAAAIERAAYEEGFAKGEAAGTRMGLEQMMPAVETFAGLVQQLNQLATNTLAGMEPEIIRLVLAIAERVIHTRIEADDKVLHRVIEAAVGEIDERWNVTVKVNPGEYETLQKYQEIFKQLDRLGKVTLLPDPSITPGGCIVQAPEGFVDATLETALARVAKIGE